MTKTNTLGPLDGHAGFLSPRYQKGQRTADALLQSGRRLLRRRPLESMTIHELCARANVTTGAFYGRFESKDAFFKALQTLAMKDLHEASTRRIAELELGEWCLHDMLHGLARNMRRWVLRHEGVLRATLLQHDPEATSWAPFRRMTHQFVASLVPHVARAAGQRADAASALRIRIAFQMMIGTIVNAAVNNPGPLALSDQRMDDELAEALCLYIGGKSVRTNHASRVDD